MEFTNLLVELWLLLVTFSRAILEHCASVAFGPGMATMKAIYIRAHRYGRKKNLLGGIALHSQLPLYTSRPWDHVTGNIALRS